MEVMEVALGVLAGVRAVLNGVGEWLTVTRQAGIVFALISLMESRVAEVVA